MFNTIFVLDMVKSVFKWYQNRISTIWNGLKNRQFSSEITCDLLCTNIIIINIIIIDLQHAT